MLVTKPEVRAACSTDWLAPMCLSVSSALANKTRSRLRKLLGAQQEVVEVCSASSDQVFLVFDGREVRRWGLEED